MRPALRFHGCRFSELQCDGHRLLVLENERLRVGVLVSKGAEIVEFRHKALDLDVLWHTGERLPDPACFRPESVVGAQSFFDQYSGVWQESFPTGNAMGEYRGAQLGLHGEVGLLPWDYTILTDRSNRIEVELTVRCRRTPFMLQRRMALSGHSYVVEFDERITNPSNETLEYAWGHHPAFGAPLLDSNTCLDLPQGSLRTMPSAPGQRRRFKAEQQGRVPYLQGTQGQRVDIRRLPAPASRTWDNFEIRIAGPGRLAIRNPRLDAGFAMTWDARCFPYLWEWEVAQGFRDYPFWGRHYLLALEPFNCPIGGLPTFAGKGILPRLRPGESRRTKLQAGFCSGRTPFKGRFLAAR